MKYKIIILVLFLSSMAFGQSLLLFDGISYNGTERITNAIDRDMEVGSEVITNGAFTSNITGWSGNASTPFWYNTDWNGVVPPNIPCLLDSATGTSGVNIGFPSSYSNGVRYKLTYSYYLPSSNTTGVAITPRFIGGANPFLTIRSVQDAWTTVTEYHTAGANYTTIVFYLTLIGGGVSGQTAGDKFYLDDVSIKQVPNYASNGNHTVDSSSVFKYADSYSTKITASAAGDTTTNFSSLASTLFTAVATGKWYRFSVYAYTITAGTTLSFNLGDKIVTKTVDTAGFTKLNFDFKATASTTGNIKLYLNKASTVYLDSATLKQGR